MTTTHQRRRRNPLLNTALAALALPLPLRASDLYFVGPDNGNWNDPAHWAADPAAPGGAGVPTPDDDAYLTPATNLRVNLDPNYSPQIGALYLDATGGPTVTLSQSAGTFTTWDTTVGLTGRGSFAQTGGTHALYGDLTLGDSPGSAGSYSLSNDATLSLQGRIILGYNGAGTLAQSGSSVVNVPYGSLDIGYARNAPGGTYSLSGAASLHVYDIEWIGEQSPATFVQTGGTHTAGSILFLDNDSSYTLANDASLHVASDEYFGGSGGTTFTHAGGTHTTAGGIYVGQDPDALATYSLSGNNARLAVAGNLEIAAGGPATFTQSAGSNSVTNSLSVGAAGGNIGGHQYFTTGAYSLSGTGSLAVAHDEFIGALGNTGSFTQTGGSHTVAATLYVGAVPVLYYDPARGSTVGYGNGSYSLAANGSLAVGGDELVGYHGSAGSFTQSGGTHSVAGTLTLAAGAGPDGTPPAASYTLSAGSLTAAATSLNANARFLLTGGSASLGALSLTATAQLLLSPGHDKTLRASTLSITPDARLDLADNTLLLTATPADALRPYLLAHQLFSSLADPTHALGYAPDPTSPASLRVELTLIGDANLDGKLNADDFALLDKGYAQHASTWFQGDFNDDGIVNTQDYLLIDRSFLFQAQGSQTLGLLAQRRSQFGPDYLTGLFATLPEPIIFLPALFTVFPRRPRR